FTLDEKETSDVRILTCESEKSRFNVVLCVTASGKNLSPYVIFKGKTPPKGKFSTNILISTNEKDTMNSAEMQLWAEKIWNKKKNSFFMQKSILIIDDAPGHKTDEKKVKFRKTSTTLAMI
ncbi:hypothetical protein MXB_2839, partial [Myxobolus squamalis]